MEFKSRVRTNWAFSKVTFFGMCLAVLFSASGIQGTELKSRFAKFGDTKVHYQDSGKGKEALIFVHGWTCDSNFWRGQTSAFPGQRVIAVDLPGHGQSDKPQLSYTMTFFAHSIDAVMRDAKVERAVLVGHSMGTPIIWQFYKLYPDKTLSLVIVDGALRLFFPKAQMDQFLERLRSNYQTAGSQMVDGLLAPIKDAKLKGEIRTAMLSAPDYVAISAMEGMADEKVYEKAPIKVPVLAILAKSPFWSADTEQFLRSLAPNLEYHMWDDVSHFLMMERPQEFNETLKGSLTKNKLLKR
ncbi:MAG: alpha/beta fold hydrolase [Pyrinomonadaceae bacterium]